MSTHKIVSRWNSEKVLFECAIPDGLQSGMAVRHALEKAVASDANLRGADLRGANLRDADLRGANLRGADLRGADLRGANLRGANLRDAYLSGADLRDAYLSGADLRGAYLRDVPAAEQIARLDTVREIILDNTERLEMGHWHDGEEWRDRTCAEEAVCGTTHCLAGWLQVCSTDSAMRAKDPEHAGFLLAPIAAPHFFDGASAVLDWLRERKYVGELAAADAAIAPAGGAAE